MVGGGSAQHKELYERVTALGGLGTTDLEGNSTLEKH